MGDYKFKFINNIKDQELISQISKMCQNADRDFVPPLSSRNSTSQTQFKAGQNHNDVSGYVEELKKQHIIILSLLTRNLEKSWNCVAFSLTKKISALRLGMGKA